VLEHILDLPSAFKEMYRILKPGGIMIHSYDPYFHPAGGHGLGVLDMPWGHLQVNPDEYERYIKEFRPFEIDQAMNWYKNGVHKKYPKRLMMKLVLDSGFKILFWNTRKINKHQRSRIGNSLMRNVFKNYPEISFDDLLACEHTFIAQKI
jgi:ubiquinone/menaquinone biosynthesis C-methylase UbiE